MKSNQLNFEKTVQSRKSTQICKIGAFDSSRNTNLRNCERIVKVIDGQNMKNMQKKCNKCKKWQFEF